MTLGHSLEDRRSRPRVDGTSIDVALRPRGRLGAIAAHAVDFNRYGTAVHTQAPLPKDQVVYLTLRCGEVRVENVVGVVHNCVRQSGRYRSGILFRLSSDLQQDKQETRALLARLETMLLDGREAAGRT